MTGILFVFGVLFVIMGSFIIFCSTIGFIRNQDFFIKTHAVSLSNIYGISLILLGEVLQDFDFKTFLTILIIITTNIIITFLVIHAITRFAFIENVKHNAVNRRNLKKKKK